jgi:hypothetical protein
LCWYFSNVATRSTGNDADFAASMTFSRHPGSGAGTAFLNRRGIDVASNLSNLQGEPIENCVLIL